MERLTEKTVGCFEYALKDHTPVPGEFGTYEAFFDYSMAVRKLGKYEDAEEAKALKRMTNGDCIRAMRDEELAEIISDSGCPPKISDIVCETTDNCNVCWCNWLKQPAEVKHE